MRKLYLLLIGTLFTVAGTNAQVILAPSVISSGGGYGENGNMRISWTLGELAVSTLQSGNIMLTQGFQQPFDIGVGIKSPGLNWGISVYPNPVGDLLTIKFSVEKTGDYLLEIQDVTGRMISQLLKKQISPGDVVNLNTEQLTPGIYFLKVLAQDLQQVQVTSLRKL